MVFANAMALAAAANRDIIVVRDEFTSLEVEQAFKKYALTEPPPRDDPAKENRPLPARPFKRSRSKYNPVEEDRKHGA